MSRVLRTQAYPTEGSNAKKSFVERKLINDGELLMVIFVIIISDTQCKVFELQVWFWLDIKKKKANNKK